MKPGTLKWVVALTVSGVIHAGAAALVLPRMNEPKIAGGAPAEIAVSGNAFADQVSAGETSEAVDPVQQTVSETRPVEAEVAEAEPADAVQATRPEPPDETETVETVETPVAEPETTATPTPEVDQTPEADIAIAERPESEAAESEPVQEAERAEPAEETRPVETEETVTAMADVPRPTPRPQYTPPRRTERPEPKREAAPRPSGSGGQNQADTRRGAQDGRQNGQAARQGQQSARANAAGNAAVSNYPGKVVGRLRRALRYPAAARRDRVEGEVHVRFTVASSGAVSGVRVARSSGSSVLDRAAVATVQRAAPFPAIPNGSGRSSWPFTVPLAFVR